MRKLFMDTEFTGLRKDTTLISIGIVDDKGREFYAELSDYDKSQVDEWIDSNVIKNLLGLTEPRKEHKNSSLRIDTTHVYGDRDHVAKELKRWLEVGYKYEVWADCLAYDWVLFCDLFGGAMKLPKNIYYIPFDICTLMKEKGVDPDVNRETYAELSSSKGKHNSLFDAKMTKIIYNKLCSK